MRLKAPKVPAAQSLETGSLRGPMLPEGAYTVKLLKGDELYTTQLKLIGDPSLPHSAEDRRLQQQTVMTLYRMLERLAYLSAAVADARDQAAERLKKLASGDPSYKEIDNLRSRLDDMVKTIVPTGDPGSMPGISGEIRLREEIGEVYGDVSRYGGRPTQSQIDRTAALGQRVEDVNRSFDKLASGFGPVNIHVLTKEEYEKRESHGQLGKSGFVLPVF